MSYICQNHTHGEHRVNPNGNYELQLMMYPYWFISRNKCTILILDGSNSDTVWWRQRKFGNLVLYNFL